MTKLLTSIHLLIIKKKKEKKKKRKRLMLSFERLPFIVLIDGQCDLAIV